MPANPLPRPPRPSQTKIVATLGPASSEPGQIAELIAAGVDVFRLNMAHGDPEEQEERLAAIRRASDESGQPVAVLTDLAGPKIRLGELSGGELMCDAGDAICFVRTPAHPPRAPVEDRGEGEPKAERPTELTTTYEPLIDELAAGSKRWARTALDARSFSRA